MESSIGYTDIADTEEFYGALDIMVNVYNLVEKVKDLRVLLHEHSKMRDALNDRMKKLLAYSVKGLEEAERLSWFKENPSDGLDIVYSMTLFMATYKSLHEMGYFFKFSEYEKGIYKTLKDNGIECPGTKDLLDLFDIQPDRLWNEKDVKEKLPWLGWEKRREAEMMNCPGVKKSVAKN